jgi:hypothetical protein
MLNPSAKISTSDISGEIYAEDFPRLNESVIKFGYVPDITNLRPGDLILTVPVIIDAKTATIQSSQKKIWRDNYEWTHSLLYVGAGRCIDLVPGKNVQIADIFNLVPDYKIRCRRPKFA